MTSDLVAPTVTGVDFVCVPTRDHDRAVEARPNCAPIALRVDDVAAARGSLEAKGVTFIVELLDSGVVVGAARA